MLIGYSVSILGEMTSSGLTAVLLKVVEFIWPRPLMLVGYLVELKVK
jgi:hypothetical protein